MICCKYCGRPTKRLFDSFCSECGERLKRDPFEFEAALREPARMTLNEVLVRVIAGLLGVGGAFWGFLLFAIFHSEGDGLRVLGFAAIAGPGYLVTAGYFWRAAVRSTYQWRVAIWIASILVQGTWLLVSVFAVSVNPATLWWLFASAASVAALSMESPFEATGLHRVRQ